MTVINPNSISGITSITLPSGGDNVLTIHTNDGVERFRIDSSGNVKVGSAATISPDGDLFVTGVTTATTYSGSAASLTNVPAANVVGVHTSLTVTNATTTGTAVVGGGVTISESGIEATGVGITCANINGTQIGGRRNLMINGAMNVAQRATTATGVNGYVTIDRFNTDYGGENEAPTYTQGDVSSGTTPYTEGFRKTWKITNGNQTGGAGSSDYIFIRTKLEAQDLANSGWNYTSSSSFITMSFWVKSSVAQTFYGRLESVDGTSYNYPYSYALSANTWTKVVKTIPGNSNLQIDNNNGSGMEFHWDTFRGTGYSSNSVALNTWATYASGTRTPHQTSTWWETNDATWEITGVQVEVGSQATAFEHRSLGEETTLCQRYFQQVTGDGTNVGLGFYYNSSYLQILYRFPVEMRTTPTIDDITGTHYYVIYRDGAADTFNSVTLDSGSNNQQALFYNGSEVSGTAGQTGIVRTNNAAPSGGQIQFNAEL